MELLLTKEGYDEFLEEIEKLNNKIYEIGLIKKEANEQAPGDGWHDNFLYEDAVRQEKEVMHRISSLQKMKKDIKIIHKQQNKQLIDIDDIIKLEIEYKTDDKEIEEFKLVGNNIAKSDNEITINSPLGRAIYLKKVNDKVKYKVNDNYIYVHILEKR